MSLLRVAVVGMVLPVVLPVVLLAGVVAVPGAALAANSAVEVLDDDDERPLAGATRYETAALIAQAYVDESLDNSDYTVSDVIVVSGVGFADALSAAALAGAQRAPILLTPPNALASAVRSFILRNNIDSVYIIGGTSAVSASVSQSLDALAGISVTRLSGANRYSTALRVAEEVGGASGGALGTYCSTRDQSVLLANGQGFADALAGGPLAYDYQLPILLTPSSTLPNDVETYLENARVERVIILGGTRVVPTAIERRIENLGIIVDRHSGNDRFATATAITTALTVGSEDCGWEATDFGLANGRTPYDALAGSALLGLRRSPLLLTERDLLPTATADYLEDTPTTSQGESVNINFTTLGGNNTITPRVVTQTINAAITSDALTADIVARPGERMFVVNFSEEVDPDTAVLINAYLIDGESLITGDQIDYFTADQDASNPRAHVQVTLDSFRLEADAVVEVVGDTIKANLFDQGDIRTVAPVRYAIPEDRLRPRLSIFAIAGSDEVWIRISEEAFTNGGNSLSSFDVSIDAAGTSNDETIVASQSGHDELLWSASLTAASSLSTNDKVKVDSREVYDLAGNSNTTTQVSVRSIRKPQLSELLVTRFQYPEQAETSGLSGFAGLEVAARANGDYAGAAGNSWSVEFLAANTTRVHVTENRRRVLFEIRDPDFGSSTDDSPVTVDELFKAADSSTAFTRNFQFLNRSDADLTDTINPSFNISEPMAGGSTSADVYARWTQPVTIAESLIEVCSGSCNTDNQGSIPSTWALSDRSATSSAYSEIVEWKITETVDPDNVPTTSWSVVFMAGAVINQSGGTSSDNAEVTRRVRLRS